MAVELLAASSEHYYRSASLSGDVFTFAAWVYLTDLSVDRTIIAAGDEAQTNNNYFQLRYDQSSNDLRFVTRDATTNGIALSTITPATNTWYHVVGSMSGLSSRSVWVNGGNKGTNTTTLTSWSSTIDNIAVGAYRDASPGVYLNGSIFMPAVWQGWAAGDDDVLAMAAGVPPWKFAPDKLIFFTPLASADGTPRDWISGTALTVNGTPTTAESPHVMSAGGILTPSYAPEAHHFVGSATEYVASGTSITITHGLDIQADDVLIAILHHGSAGTISSTGGLFTSTFTEENPTAETSQIAFFERVATASEGSSFTFTSAGTTNRFACHLLQFRGIDTTDIWDVAPSASTRGTVEPGTTLASPVALTTTADNTIGLGVCTTDNADVTFSGYTVGANEVEHGSGQGLSEVTQAYTSPGAKTGFNAVSNQSQNLIMYHFAVKGISGAQITTPFAVQKKSQGNNGYTVDFQTVRQVWDNTGGGFNEFGDIAISEPHSYSSVTGRLSVDNDVTPIPTFFLNPSRFSFGSEQFSECGVFVDVTGSTSQTWIGPSVFNCGDTISAGTSTETMYCILVQNAGSGTSEYTLYRRPDDGSWDQLDTVTGKVDASSKIVTLRLEAIELSDRIRLNWWIDGEKQATYDDTNATLRVTSSSSTTNNGLTAPGLAFGNNGTSDLYCHVYWMRGGNLPEVKTVPVWYTPEAGISITSVTPSSWADGTTGIVIAGSGFLQ